MSGSAIDLVLEILREGKKFDITAAVTAVRNKDADGILAAVEQITDILVDFGVPYANDAKMAEVILGFFVHGYETGAIASAPVEDPAMQRAAGNTGQGTPQMHQAPPEFPGATPNDPYGWDAGNKL